ncbi:hypothetical protein [Bifidobacterium mongoliense]|uniref:hypothetical protein n=2 Tax=Bifidobacterium mongoliense TaxID=518643 RepID=UPI0026499252|nr:hypothetical protein [Bifidobacterium mongoliense]MDN6050992.1 hypothetical protein [Bifidobacterium mongoliense]
MVLCAGSAQYGAFELVRCDPREQLKMNMTWLVVVGVVGALSALLIFVLMEFVVFAHRITPGVASLSLMLLVQTFMMVQAIGLMCLLFVNFGLPWGQFLPVVIGFFILASWLLNPLAGNATKYVYYFWYPISPVWRVVAVDQIIPFVGYCLLMVVSNVAAFERTDRLGQ